MFKSGLTAIRQNEHLILNDKLNVYVNGEITQYLLNHQINGVQFLFRNYQKQCASILNDESGSGKCFQCIAFFDGILRIAKTNQILVICHRKESLEHWHFHVDCFLENVQINMADDQRDTQTETSSNTITIASLDHVLNNLPQFTSTKFECVVFQDQYLHTSSQSFAHLNKIEAKYKIALCSNDLIEDDLAYFYELLKFCEHKTILKQSNNGDTILKLDEFKSRFGCKSDKSMSKRTQAFRQRNLLNGCSEFYLRRICSQLGSQFPPITIDDFQKNFDEWKTITCDTVPMATESMQDDDFSPIELLPAPNNRSLNSSNHDEVSILNVACTDFSDFDTQMSPLIYSDSDASIADDDNDDVHVDDRQIIDKHNDNDHGNIIECSPNINSQQLTPEIVCNQEHAAKARAITKISIPTTSKLHTTPVQRIDRTRTKQISPSTKRLNYKQLSVEIKSNSNGRHHSQSKTYLFRTKKQTCQSTQICDSESQKMPKFSTSSTSDVQIISQETEDLSPIILSTSSSEMLSQGTNEANNQNESIPNLNCQSPDLFNSFISTKSETKAIGQCDQINELKQSDTKTFRDVFGAPDECDEIDLLSNTNVDIFEITKNNVFENVLCSASDRITPLKAATTTNAITVKKSSPIVNCLSGLRVILPKLDKQDVQDIQEHLTEPPIASQSSVDIVDLTLNESQKIIEISSEDSIRDVEKTPDRKRDLTPSTRSCLKRHSNETSVINEKRKTPSSRLGWLSTNKTSPKSETPQSRRRFDKWKHRTDLNNISVDDNFKISKPRNLFKEFKSKSKSKSNANNRYNIPSTSTAESPSIFSDHD